MRRVPPRIRGDDRSGEHAPIRPVRKKSPRENPDPQLPLLYAEREPLIHGNQLEPLTDQYVRPGLEAVRALRRAQYEQATLELKADP